MIFFMVFVDLCLRKEEFVVQVERVIILFVFGVCPAAA